MSKFEKFFITLLYILIVFLMIRTYQEIKFMHDTYAPNYMTPEEVHEYNQRMIRLSRNQ